MAATRLIALHVNKGKTVAQCLADRTDYSQNAAKTNDSEFISSYECDPKTADEEFLLSKRQYQHITGRQQKNNIIAYQIRQSFKPGEITPEEANQVGYETAMRWTKGKHAFIVATHIDKSHIHNHIIYNSTSLDATRKFKNFFLSGLAVQRLSDMVCLEHGLSIITPKPYRERQKRTVYPKKRTQRDELCDAIDAVLKQKPKSFDGFVQALADMGFEFKDGKQPAFKGENQKRFIRLRSLGEGYSKEEIQAVVSGKNLHKSKGSSAKAPAPKQFQMLIDIQAKMAEGKTVGYEKWAKKFNRKEAARTVILLKEKGLGNYDDLTAHIENLSARFDALILSRPQRSEWLRFRRCSSTSKIIATQGKSISSTARLDIAKSSLRNTVRKSQFIKRRSKPLTNCRLQSSHLCNRCMRSFISWQSRKSKTTLSTVRSEKKKKNC